MNRLLVILLGTMLSGCVGIAHTAFGVPALRVVLEQDSARAPVMVEVFQPRFYGEHDVWIALANGTVRTEVPQTQRATLNVSSDEAKQHEFPPHKRYIGSMVFLFPFLTSPSDEVGRLQSVWFRIADGDTIYEVVIHGQTIRTMEASIAESQRTMPDNVRGDSIPPPKPGWEAQVEARSAFFRAVKWIPTQRIEARILQRSESLDVLVVRMRP